MPNNPILSPFLTRTTSSRALPNGSSVFLSMRLPSIQGKLQPLASSSVCSISQSNSWLPQQAASMWNWFRQCTICQPLNRVDRMDGEKASPENRVIVLSFRCLSRCALKQQAPAYDVFQFGCTSYTSLKCRIRSRSYLSGVYAVQGFYGYMVIIKIGLIQNIIQMANELNCSWLVSYTLFDLKFPKSTLASVPIVKILDEANMLPSLIKKAIVCLGCSLILLKQLRFTTNDMEALAETFVMQKKAREERPRGGGGPNPNKRRRQKKQKIENLEELSNQSISNPRNVEQPRPGDKADNQLKLSSHGSDDTDKENSLGDNKNFQNQIDRIAIGDTMMPIDGGAGFVPSLQPGVDQQYGWAPIDPNLDSDSNSSSNSLGVISNLSQKMKMLMPQQPKSQTKTKRRPAKPSRENTRTKRAKADHIMMDESTREDIEMSRSYNNISEFKIEEDTRLSRIEEVNEDMAVELDVNKLLRGEGFEKFKEFSREMRAISITKDHFFTDTDIHQDGGDISFKPIQFPEHPSHQDSNLLPESFPSQSTISAFSKQLKLSKAQTLYRLLGLAQQHKIRLSQHNPQHFSEIVISRVF